MDERIRNIDTPEKCEIFARNALSKGRQDLANKARLRAVELRAESYGAESQAEKEALQAVYAYEETLRLKNGKKTRATRTWQMITRYGIIEALNRAVNRPPETEGYKALMNLGLEDFAFEAVILRYPAIFSDEAVEMSRLRLEQWKHTELS